MKNDEIDDAQLNAFLKGEDELSRRLQAMAQPSPDAQLDAAILKRVKFAAAQEGRGGAANDAGAQARRPARPLSWRWRIPAGIAATVLAGVFAHQAFRASDREQVPAEAPASEVLAEVPQAEPSAAAPPAPAQGSLKMTPAKKLSPPAREHATNQRLADSDKRSAAAADVAAQPAPMPQEAARAAAPPMPAAMAAPGYQAKETVRVTASRVARSAAPVKLAEDAIPDAAAWLARIDEMLKAGMQSDATREWGRFREAYPDYPVPDSFTARLKAIEK